MLPLKIFGILLEYGRVSLHPTREKGSLSGDAAPLGLGAPPLGRGAPIPGGLGVSCGRPGGTLGRGAVAGAD